MDNNRTILAVVLIVLLWSGYSLFFAPQPQQVNTQVTETTVSDTAAATGNDSVNKASSDRDINQIQIPEDVVATTTSIETDLFHVRITSVGAAISFVDLKNYKQTNDEGSESYVFFNGEENDLRTILVSGSDGFYIPSNLNYQLVNRPGDNILITESDNKVEFAAKSNDLTILKTYTFYVDSYSFDITYQVVNNSASALSGKLNFSLVTPWNKDEKSEMYTFVGPQSYDGQELLEDDIDDIVTSPRTYKDNIVWSGYTDKYFISIVNPNADFDKLFIDSGSNYIENKFVTDSLTLNPGQSQSITYNAYFGPREFELLAQSQHRFEETINYGFFHPLAKPLMVTLKFFYSFLGNYGFAIILLTICIKIIFWPLTQKSYKSMKGMQKLQPEMKRLREKYGSDKQRLNQEMMTFYKEHKVNPLGGCLPMLIQIPVFFALYRVLLGSIELRHAPFAMWITDLSAKDPYYVTPLIMGVTMFLQQKMTPTQMDPTQEKIMLMMPVIFTFMFLNFPSGLVIYWLINNVLTILQQYLIRRQPD